MLRRSIVEQHPFTVCNKLYLLIQLGDGGTDVDRVVDSTFLVHLPVIDRQLMCQQDDVYVLTSFLNVGDGGDIFCLNILFIEHDEMLIANMRGADSGCVLVVLCVLYQSTGNVFQALLGFWIATKIYNTYHNLNTPVKG